MTDPHLFDVAPSGASHDEDQADGLTSRLSLIEAQPLAERAAAYAALHDDLSRRLDNAPRSEGSDDVTA